MKGIDFAIPTQTQNELLYANTIVKWDRMFFNGILYSPQQRLIDEKKLLEHFQNTFEFFNLYSLDDKKNIEFDKDKFAQCGQQLLKDIYTTIVPLWVVLITRYVSKNRETNLIFYKINKTQHTDLNLSSFNIDDKIQTCYSLIMKH
jgi:hypothetical protein